LSNREKLKKMAISPLYGLQDMVDYQRTLAREIEARLEAKCDALADLFAMDERGQLLKLGMNRYICI
jgi:hypothetical protein